MTMNPAEPGAAMYTCLGAAFSYYGLGALHTMNCPWSFPVWIVTVLLLTASGAVRTLAVLPPYFYADASLRYRVRRFERYFCALVMGFFLGIAFRSAAGSGAVRRGLAEEAITGIGGVLKTDPRQSSRGQGSAHLELETVSGRGGLRVSARGRITVFFPETAFPRVKGVGRGSRIFVEGAFFTSRGGDRGFRAVSVHIMNAAPWLEQTRSRVRARILRQIEAPRWGGLAQALLLGARDNLDADLVRTYQEAGCAHVLALSGLHLAIVSGLAAFLLNRLLGLKAAAIAGALFIFFYAALVGVQPSLERAVVMYFLGTLAVLGAFPRNPLTILALSCLIQLGIWPASGDSLSFILSYLALGGILTLGEALSSIMRGALPDIPARPLAASLGAFIASAPVIGAAFGELRPIGVLAGLAVIPLSTAFMIAAIGHLALSPLIPGLAEPLGTALAFLYTVLDRIVSAAAAIPAVKTAFPWAITCVVLACAALIGLISRLLDRRRNRIEPFDNGY